MSAACLEQEYSYMYVTAKPLWFLRMMVVAKAYWKSTMGLTLFGGGETLTNWVKRLLTNKTFQKSNIILESSWHPNFMYPFEYGKSFHNKSYPPYPNPTQVQDI